MKTLIILVATLTTLNLPVQSQILGIFEQGAEELSEYGQQIAALELLLTSQHNGYQIVVSGLNSISTITGTEFGLHQSYYSSLSVVNPAITQSPGMTTCLSLESQVLTALPTALARWRQSRYLTANDLEYITRISSAITNLAGSQLSTLDTLTADNDFSMTDDQRIKMLTSLYTHIQLLYSYSQSFIDAVDLLLLNRQ